MDIGIIILCRTSSSRLPNKIIRKLNGVEALLHTVNQARMVLPNRQITVATSDHSSDDSIETLCDSNNIQVYRGSLTNVAERFLNCAIAYKYDYATRLNGDNIFVNRDLLRLMQEDAVSKNFDFLSNVDNRTFPKGLSIEIIKTEVMQHYIPNINKSEEYKEHVLKYFYTSPKIKKKFYYNDEYVDPSISFALDTLEDFKNIDEMIKLLGNKYPTYNYNDLIKTYEHLER